MPANKKTPVEIETGAPVRPVRARFGVPVRFWRRTYGLFGFLVLCGTSVYWAILGARLHASNADQLVNGYMFESLRTFHEAEFPAAHTFLLKWPLFALLKLLRFTDWAYTGMTVFLVLATVIGLAYIMWRLERRMVVFGTLCLALASVLLLVPTQPYPGGILPVNFAMITTRNVEYVVFVLAIILVARFGRLKTTGHIFGTLLLGLLFASDKLFISLAVGGSMLVLASAFVFRRRVLAMVALRWLILSSVAVAISIGIQILLPFLHVTNLTNQSPLGPYGLNISPKGIGEAAVYAVLAILTNFGANPATDTRLLKEIPQNILHGFFGPAGFSYAVNFVIVLLCIFAAGVIVAAAWSKEQQNVKAIRINVPVMLLSTTIAALVAFMFSQHYYPVDSRYLTIMLFAGFVALASYVGHRNVWPKLSLLIGLALVISIGVGIPHSLETYHTQQNALVSMKQRDVAIASALHEHPVSTLVGDYWRVLPIRLVSKNKTAVLPLASCTQPRSVLSSTHWEKDLHSHSFAYLLSLDDNLTDSPKCTSSEVLRAYGRPDASVVVAGTLTQPKELLLFYDHGSELVKPKQTASNSPTTVVPVVPSQLASTTCVGTTVMNIVAHQDDDLLFMNPDIQRDLRAGHCVRTVYVTAGDAGAGEFYWLSREKGSEAAYSRMLGTPNAIWIEKVVRLSDAAYVTIASPINRPGVTLMFMHLPDGNINGQGFAASNSESLQSLSLGTIPEIHSVDGLSVYTVDSLAGALEALLGTYKPTEVRTQAQYVNDAIPDHSDHMATDLFATAAYNKYLAERFRGKTSVKIRHYVGYPVRQWPANVLGGELGQKRAAFMAYAKSDGSVCSQQRSGDCKPSSFYVSYLQREYTYNQ